MRELTANQLDEIAQNIGKGNLCFFHIRSGKVFSFSPASQDTTLSSIKLKPNDYISFERMSSRKTFDAMQAFASSVQHNTLKETLLAALTKKHPIKTFRNEIKSMPDYIIKDWTNFEARRNKSWVEEQMELYDF